MSGFQISRTVQDAESRTVFFFPEEDVMLFELNLMIKGISRKEREKGSKQAKIAVISKFCLDDLFVNMDSSDDVIVNDFARSPDGVQKNAFHRDYHIHAIFDAEKDGQSLPPAHYTIHLSKSGIDLIEEWKKKDNF